MQRIHGHTYLRHSSSPLLFATLALCCGLSLHAQERVGPGWSRQAIAEDMGHLIAAFERIAPVPYQWTDPASVRSRRDSILAHLPDTVSRGEGHRALAKCIAAYGLGHSQMVFWRPYLDSSLHFPFDVKLRDGRLLVHRNRSNDSAFVAGTEILSINGIATERMVPELLACSGFEREETRAYMVGYAFAYLLPFYFDQHGRLFRITAKAPGGAVFTASVMKAGQEPGDMLGVKEEPFSLDFPNDSIARVRIERFHSFSKRRYRSFLRAAFRDIRAKGSTVLAIDIRGNGGGDSRLLRPLAAYVMGDSTHVSFEGRCIRRTTRESKRHFRRRLLKWYTYPLYPVIACIPMARTLFFKRDGTLTTEEDNAERVRPAEHAFRGRVFLLVDRGTYSTASMLTSSFQCSGLARIVGAGAGEPTVGDGDPVELLLPNSGCMYSIGTAIWYNPCYALADADRMLVPDIPCEQGAEFEALLRHLAGGSAQER